MTIDMTTYQPSQFILPSTFFYIGILPSPLIRKLQNFKIMYSAGTALTYVTMGMIVEVSILSSPRNKLHNSVRA